MKADSAPHLLLVVQAAVVLALPGQARAQLVRGELVDSIAGRPVAAAIITLIDGADAEFGRTLTDATGQFRVRAPAAGSFRLRVRLVGFDVWESEPIALAVGETVVRRVALLLVRVKLPAITVEAEQTCVVRPEEGAAAAALWEEVKKVLAATELTMKGRGFRFRSVGTERELDRLGAVVRDTSYPSIGYRAWPFGALDPELLAQRGFVQGAAGGPVFYGPDAQLLVSDTFLDDHCFRVRLSPNEAGRIGLAFEPVTGRDVSEVDGVLWLDSATVALRQLEWGYRNLSRWAREGSPGGEVDFARLPTGAWFIRRWMLRAPIAQVFPDRPDTLFYGVKIREEEVVEVLKADGTPVMVYDTGHERR